MGTIIAKFDSKCRKCSQAVKAGSFVEWTKGVSGVAHVKCPTNPDAQLTLNGDELRARVAKLKERLALQEAVLTDRIEELTPPKPHAVCTRCQGSGVEVHKANVSDTLDYSDWQHFPYRCGDKLELKWEGRDYTVLVNGKPAILRKDARPQPGPHAYRESWLYVEAETTDPRPNQKCIDDATAMAEWECGHHEAVKQASTEHPDVWGTRQLIHWAEAELTVRRGDIATVINRGKRYTGKVVWAGTSDYTNELRVKVETADGTGKGGALATAELVSREATFSAVR